MIGVYKIESQIHPDRIYIGSSVNLKKRKDHHWWCLEHNVHHNRKLQRYVNLYGLNHLVFKIVETCSKNKIIEREQHYLDVLHPYFNLRLVAETGRGIPMSEEQKIKIGNANRGRKHSKEIIEKMKGRKRSAATRRKMSEIKKGKKGSWYGKKHSLESIQKMRDGHRRWYDKNRSPMYGKHHTPESNEKNRQKHIRKHHSPATEFKKGTKQSIEQIQRRVSHLVKPVIQLDVNGNIIREWKSIADVVRDGFHHASISYCCNNKLDSHKGYKWIFKSNYQTAKKIA